MSGTNLPEWLVTVSNQAAIIGINLMVQSTVIIGIGILTAYAFKHKGAAVQSFILRAFLAAALLSPIIIIAGRAPFTHRITFQVPQISPQRINSFPGLKDIEKPKKENDVIIPESDYKTNSSLNAEEKLSPPLHATIPHVSSGSFRQKLMSTETSRFSGNAFAILYILFFAGWAGVSLFLLLRMLAAHFYIWHIRRGAFPAKPRFREICLAAASEMGMTAPLIFQSSSVKIPFLTGLFRPAIFLPLGKAEVALPCREICIHELSHLKRHDPLWNLLWHFGIVFLPFQPLMWVLARGIEETSDYVCDDHVVKYTGAHHSYAVNLADLARIYHSHGFEASAGVGFLSFKSSLRRRIGRILDSTRTIYLSVKMSFVVYVSSICICAAFLAGLVGIRGKSFAQIRKIPESISKGALAAVIYGAGAMKEQAEEAIDAVSHNNDEDGNIESTENDNQIIDKIDNESQKKKEISSFSPENRNTINVNEAADSTESLKIAESSAETAPVHSKAELKGTGTSVSEGVTMGEKLSSKPENKNSTKFFPDLRELGSGVTNKSEPVIAKTGPMEISIPTEIPASLLESLEGGQQNPVWSPSGKVIAFAGNGGLGLWAVSVKGGKPTLVCDNTQGLTLSGSASSQNSSRILCFTPDGEAITFMRYIKKTMVNSVNKAAAESPPSTPVIENINLRTGERSVIVDDATDGCWSSDGRYFVYENRSRLGISVLDKTNGESRTITKSGYSPSLVPRASSIVYMDFGDDGHEQLFLSPLEGGVPEMLTYEGRWLNPKCSPDGEWVISAGYNGNSVSFSYLKALNLKDRKIYDIYLSGTESVEMGDWSPSGRQFCYTLSDQVAVNGKNIQRSKINIGNFSLGNNDQNKSNIEPQPFPFRLIGNYPNPFNPSTTIRYSLPSGGLIRLVIYNMTGQKVRELINGRAEAGDHSIVWDGRDQNGNKVSSGVYITRLEMERKVESHRMTLLK